MTSVDGMMLIRGCDAGAKVHQRILCFLEETGKAPHPRYVFSLPNPPSQQHEATKLFSNEHWLMHSQVGLTRSRPAPPRSSHRSRSTGTTFAPRPSPATSTSARPSVLAVFARSTDPPATVARAHPTTSMPPAPLTARSCSPWRRSVSSSRMRTREAAGSPSPASVIWTVSSLCLPVPCAYDVNIIIGIAQTTLEADEEEDDE